MTYEVNLRSGAILQVEDGVGIDLFKKWLAGETDARGAKFEQSPDHPMVLGGNSEPRDVLIAFEAIESLAPGE